MLKRLAATTLMVATLILFSLPAHAQRPLCLPVEYQTSPFFVHFKGKGAPTLVVIHGGFSSTKQSALFCAKFARVLGDKYNIVSVDYRFSSIGGGEMVDVARGIQLAREKLGTPQGRVYLLGASHGAYLALMAASETRVGAVIDAYGPTNWPIQLNFVKTRRPDIFKRWRIYLAISKSACQDMGLEFGQCLVRRSIVPSHLRGLDEPLLVIHGQRDNLVPLKESQMLVQALEKQGRKVEMVILPEKRHGFPLWEGEALKVIKGFLASLETPGKR